MANENINKARDIVNILPQKNCGKCGFENCGKFALAVINGEVSPFGCRQDPSAGREISNILGRPVSEEDAQAASQVDAGHGHHGEHHGAGNHHFGNHGHHGHHGERL